MHSNYISNPILQNKFNADFRNISCKFSYEYYSCTTKTETLLKEIAQAEKEITLIIPNLNGLN